MKDFKNSPLWVIAFFMFLVQGVAGVAVIKLEGITQLAILAFFMYYGIVTTGAFFFVLCLKPAVLYAPSEFGRPSVDEYHRVLSGNAPEDVVSSLDAAQKNPQNEIAIFELMDSLLPEDIKQHLVYASRNSGSIRLPGTDERGFTHRYSIILRNGSISFGSFNPQIFEAKLNGTDLITLSNLGNTISLSSKGKRFAQ